MTHSKLAGETRWTHQKSSRDGARIDRFIVHHAANTSVDQTLRLFAGERQVSASYALGNGRIVATVPEEERPWTSGSYEDDRRAVTVEVSNSRAGDPWPVADVEFDNLARLIADVAGRYGFPINDDTVLTHQELHTRFGRSYATACPGDLQRRKSELLALANKYAVGASSTPQATNDEDDMGIHVSADGDKTIYFWSVSQTRARKLTEQEAAVVRGGKALGVNKIYKVGPGWLNQAIALGGK